MLRELNFDSLKLCQVVRGLEVAEADLLEEKSAAVSAQTKKRKWYAVHKQLSSKSKKNKTKNKAKSKQSEVFVEDEKVSEEEKVPIEIFADFFRYWKDLWKTMMEPKVSRFYFHKDPEITLIAGMMKRTRAHSNADVKRKRSTRTSLQCSTSRCGSRLGCHSVSKLCACIEAMSTAPFPACSFLWSFCAGLHEPPEAVSMSSRWRHATGTRKK